MPMTDESDDRDLSADRDPSGSGARGVAVGTVGAWPGRGFIGNARPSPAWAEGQSGSRMSRVTAYGPATQYEFGTPKPPVGAKYITAAIAQGYSTGNGGVPGPS